MKIIVNLKIHMWELKKTEPVKLLIGILATDKHSLTFAVDAIIAQFGQADFYSDIWPFTQTTYYKDQTGENILRQFLTIEKLIDPEQLSQVKHQTNKIEQDIAGQLAEIAGFPRPINLDPGIIEPSKLVLASTKNFSHRIYIGNQIYAEITLTYNKGIWKDFVFTYPDYKEAEYHKFFSKVRTRLTEQLREIE